MLAYVGFHLQFACTRLSATLAIDESGRVGSDR